MSDIGYRAQNEILPGAPLEGKTVCVWYGHVMGGSTETSPPMPMLYLTLTEADMTTNDPHKVAGIMASRLSEELATDPTFARMLAEWIESKR